jgi:ferredoxin
MEAICSPGGIPPLQVPGNFPYKERRQPSERFSPDTREDQCIKCGKCVDACPKSLITMTPVITTEQDACTRCCACVKNCPTDARVMEHPSVKKAAEWLNTNFSTRKEPETYT